MRPRVLQLVCSFHEGGSERQAIQLTRLLLESDRCDVGLAVLDGKGVLRDAVEGLGLGEILEFPLRSFYDFNYVKQLLRFAHILRKRRINILQTSDFYTNVFGMMAGALARVPIRIAARRETTGCRTGPQKLVERISYRLAHRVVANAEAVRSQLIDEGVSPGKIVTIHNGLDTRRVMLKNHNRDSALAALNLPSDGSRFITMVANLRSPVKNFPMFLRAARIVTNAMPEARFVVAGEGNLLEPTRALASRMGMADSIIFLGRCQRIAELLAATDVCAFSSSHEGFSNSILEYMAAGRPVVVTDAGGTREAVSEGESGYIVPADDHDSMADRIITLLRDPDKARMFGERGKAIAAQKFSLEVQLERTLELYETLLLTRLRPLPVTVTRATPRKQMKEAS